MLVITALIDILKVVMEMKLHLSGRETTLKGIKPIPTKNDSGTVLLALTGPEHMIIQGHQTSNIKKFENHLEQICKTVNAMKKKLIIKQLL